VVVRQVSTAPGLTLSAEQRNPMHHYRINEKTGIKVLRFTEGRALWRDSSALLGPENASVIKPAGLGWVEELKFNGCLPERKLTLAAFGMSTDPGKQKVFFYRGEQFEFSDTLLANEELANILQQGLDLAETLRIQLWGALNSMVGLLLNPEANLHGEPIRSSEDAKKLLAHWDVEALYWAKLELPFYRFLDHLPEDRQTAFIQWKKDLRQAVLVAFEQATSLAGSSVKALKATAKSQVQLYAGLKKALEANQ
jgi:CRISPR system Cascade subunit CasA